jgi:adenine-specific DNA-methyltransferase
MAVVRDRTDALVLDYFAGSGTTLHATALLNRADGGRRRCVLVTNNEVDEETAGRLNKAGYFRGDAEFERHGIFEAVTLPRVQTALTGVRPGGTPVPTGKAFRYLDGHPWSEGFKENCVFLRLDYLEPDDVELGRQFAAIVPILWMASGGLGPNPDPTAAGGYLLPAESPFAVLLRESAFRRFAAALAERPDVTHVWLVTDSERAFADMRSALAGDYCVSMLYRDYLRNFAINMVRTV